ncbi:MAG: 3-methylcrotonyl-CoA carboxylase alpha subunit [Paracoccaceae bacterium]|jgi:3-methylcrotonyl-CoA carboxylase alpha subunit
MRSLKNAHRLGNKTHLSNAMFNKILIANRGEIACRVINTAKRLGVKTVAVYSEADRNSLHVKLADEAIHIGPAASSESYLVIEKIIAAALKTGSQAIHPGYGFLSENAKFAQACHDNKLLFIGPPIPAIKAMGSKSAAKTIMEKAGVPLVPGYHGEDPSPQVLKNAANGMGYPVLLKAIAGGGGKGMRQVWSEAEFDTELDAAKREALSSFGNDDMLVEKYLTAPRHVEFQVFCDSHGNALHLFERDCTVQRRHQKVIEEAPAPNFSDQLREKMGDAAVRAAQAIDYQGAGTVEFLLDQDGSFYFMEMNTRLQVEHPVTEMITGQDLVEWQLLVAAGERLPAKQADLKIHGHAFEARIYAEDPYNDFLPTAGKLIGLKLPETSKTVRIDTGVVASDEISPFYDPMISKLVVWAETRALALNKLVTALDQYNISGITSNVSFLRALASHTAFANAELDTGFIEKHADDLFQKPTIDACVVLPLVSLFLILNKSKADTPWTKINTWRLNQSNTQRLMLCIDQQDYITEIEHKPSTQSYRINVDDNSYDVAGRYVDGELQATVNGHNQRVTILKSLVGYSLFIDGQTIAFDIAQRDYGDAQDATSNSHFNAPMNGTVVDVLVEAGSRVKEGDSLIIMEAMKMQHAIKAPSDGCIVDVFYAKGELVDGGSELLTFTTDTASDEKP